MTSPPRTSRPGSAPPAGIAARTVPRPRNHHERRLQIFLVRQFRRLVSPLDGLIVALENGEDRTESTLALLHALGVEDGTPDLMILALGGGHRLVEVKLVSNLYHPGTGLSDAQRDMHASLTWLGHKVDVVRSAVEFWAIVDAMGIVHQPVPVTAEQLPLLGPGRPKRG